MRILGTDERQACVVLVFFADGRHQGLRGQHTAAGVDDVGEAPRVRGNPALLVLEDVAVGLDEDLVPGGGLR